MDDHWRFQRPDKRNKPASTDDAADNTASAGTSAAANGANNGGSDRTSVGSTVPGAGYYRYAPGFEAAEGDELAGGDVAPYADDPAAEAGAWPGDNSSAPQVDAAWMRPYLDSSGPRRRGAQRSLEEALVSWWSDGRLPPPAVVRDGLMMLEAGIDVEESHRSLLLRSALHYRRGMLTALKHQRDPERTALILREALLDADAPLPLAELSRLIREDPGSAQWLPRLEAELVTPALAADLVRSARANAALMHLTDPAGTPDVFLAATGSARDGRPVWWRLLWLIAAAVVVAALIGGWARSRTLATFARIPNGEYAVFNPDGSTRTVQLTGFWLGRREVTNGEYARCVDKGACPAPALRASATRPGYFDDPAFADYPVVNVERAAARAYCQWRGGRLPTESEWQVAASYSPVLARAYRYPWGDRYAAGLANDADAAVGDTLQVGSFMPAGGSPWGNADMAGNVAEWTLSDGQEGMAIVKGGSFVDDAAAVQSGARQLAAPTATEPWLGFRCVTVPFSLW